MDTAAIFDGLNDQQSEAVRAVRGPVCILAGAGSGKTTTITRRIANQVVSGTFGAGDILAVTFTDRAAGEMRSRLAVLGVDGVRARTFHSAALAQLRFFSQNQAPQIMPSKAIALRQLGNTLPAPYKFRPAADLATEIEWAKNRRVTPERYLDELGTHEPPIPADLMLRIYQRYEQGKHERNVIDFEDLLEFTIQMFDADEFVRDRFASQYKAFTVDEYQDVNLLQETLLRHWVGGRDDVCAVGDDYQSIYGFTGATPDYLLDMPRRFHNTKVIRLETNYRSTTEILDTANRLVPNLGGAEKVLRANSGSGPEPILRSFVGEQAELRVLVEQIRKLHAEGVAYEEMAILYRVNFRSQDYEEALTEARIPFQVSDGAFLTRLTGRQMCATLKRSTSVFVATDVRALADKAGYLEEPPEDMGTQEITRQADLARFVRLAKEFDDGTRTSGEFVADLETRFGGDGKGRGVNLLTYHRAKGLEFEAVFLPRLEDGELPFKRSRTAEAMLEERRLFYVGITRAKRYLMVSWVTDGKRKPSTFVRELQGQSGRVDDSVGAKQQQPVPSIPAAVGLELEVSGGYAGAITEILDDGVMIEFGQGSLMKVGYGDMVTCEGKREPLGPPSDAVFGELKAWRLKRSRADEVPAYVVFPDTTLVAIAETSPRNLDDLAAISGIGPTKLERYGEEVLAIVARTAPSLK